MAKADEFVARFVDIARHLSQGDGGGPGSIHSISADGDTLVITMNEAEDGGHLTLEGEEHKPAPAARRFKLEVASNRAVKKHVPAPEA